MYQNKDNLFNNVCILLSFYNIDFCDDSGISDSMFYDYKLI